MKCICLLDLIGLVLELLSDVPTWLVPIGLVIGGWMGGVLSRVFFFFWLKAIPMGWMEGWEVEICFAR